MSRPRILFVAPKAPYPQTSGLAMRQFNLLRAYSSIASVDLAFFARDESEVAEVRRGLREYCGRIYPAPLPPERRTGTFGGWPGWRGLRYPMLAVGWRSHGLRELVSELADSIDLIHVSRLHLADLVDPLLRRRKRPRLILDLDDVESVAQRRLLRLSPSRRRIYRLFRYCDLLRLDAYERQVVRAFDRVFVCSAHDRRRFARPNVVVVPNGIQVPAGLSEQKADIRTLLFCGLLSYRPNEDAVLYFVREIFPAIRRDVPDARFVVIGRAPSPAICALDNGASIRVHADVPNVADYYRAATVAVAPLRVGGGTRIKILEAWAHGVPVVSTSIGCEGLEGVDGDHFIIAETPQQFARACVALMRSPARREALIVAARKLVSEMYDSDVAASTAVRAVRELLNIPETVICDTRDRNECLA